MVPFAHARWRFDYTPPHVARADSNDGLFGPIYRLLDVLEQYAGLVYLLVSLAILALLIGGMVQAWRSQELHGESKSALRRDMLRLLRRELGGMSADQLAREVGQPPLTLVRILEEMQEEGLVTSHTNTQRLTTWHLKGTQGKR